MKQFLFLLLLAAGFACKQKKSDSSPPVADSITLQYNPSPDPDDQPVKNPDSLLTLALKRASLGFDDSSGPVSDTIHAEGVEGFAALEFGTIFSKTRKHLSIKRYSSNMFPELYVDVFLFRKGRFIPIFADSVIDASRQDSLGDINGDGWPDIILQSYSSAGCCPRDAWTCYLFNNNTGKFIRRELFNAQFSADNNYFYESDYGQPGLIKLYKYKWVGFSKQLLEEFYPTGADGLNLPPQPFTYTRKTFPGGKTQILKTAPPEYEQLDIFTYFSSYQK